MSASHQGGKRGAASSRGVRRLPAFPNEVTEAPVSNSASRQNASVAETGPAGVGKGGRQRLCPAAPGCLLQHWQSPWRLLRCHLSGTWCPAASKPVTTASVTKMSSASKGRRPQKSPPPWTGGGGPQRRLGGRAKRSRTRSGAHCSRRRSQGERVRDVDVQDHGWRLRTPETQWWPLQTLLTKSPPRLWRPCCTSGPQPMF